MGTFRLTKRWVSYAIVAAVSGLAVSGIAAIAAKKPSGSQITACYAKKSGALRVVKAGKRCKRGERKIAWTKNGARGTRGIRGARGSQGPEGGNGARGATGPAGVAGAPGANGSPGATEPMEPHALMRRSTTSVTITSPRERRLTGTVTNLRCDYRIYCLTQLDGPTLGARSSVLRSRRLHRPPFGTPPQRDHGSAELRGAHGQLISDHRVRGSHLRLWRYRVRLQCLSIHRAVTHPRRIERRILMRKTAYRRC